MTANWEVLCYDHNLRLMWTRRIKVNPDPHVCDLCLPEVMMPAGLPCCACNLMLPVLGCVLPV